MLAGVLLYVIESTWPIDTAIYFGANFWRRSLKHMKDAVVAIINAFHDSGTVKGSRITRLSATSGIKRRPIQNNLCPATDLFTHVKDTSVEFDEMEARSPEPHMQEQIAI